MTSTPVAGFTRFPLKGAALADRRRRIRRFCWVG